MGKAGGQKVTMSFETKYLSFSTFEFFFIHFKALKHRYFGKKIKAWVITNVFEYNGLFEYFEQNPDRVFCCSDIVYRFLFLCTNVCTVSMYIL